MRPDNIDGSTDHATGAGKAATSAAKTVAGNDSEQQQHKEDVDKARTTMAISIATLGGGVIFWCHAATVATALLPTAATTILLLQDITCLLPTAS